jgi:hypothetical protein
MTIKDGDWELFEYDYQTGRSVWVMFDGAMTHFRTDYPVTATIAENEAVRNAASRAWKGDYHRVASVPLNVLHDENIGLLKAHEQGDDAYVSRWLNSSDNRAWRTKDGRL